MKTGFIFLILAFGFSAICTDKEDPFEKYLKKEFKAEGERLLARKWYNQIKERMKSIDLPIQFYGKVIDQNGVPLVNAVVTYYTSGYCPDNYERYYFNTNRPVNVVKTNNSGLFEITGVEGAELIIKKLEISGYEYLKENTSFDYIGDLQNRLHAIVAGEEYKKPTKEELKKHFGGDFDEEAYEKDLIVGPFKPDKNNPVIFKMRKKEKQEFMLDSKEAIHFYNELENICYIDAADLRSTKFYTNKAGFGEWSKQYHADLILSIKDERNNRFVFTVQDKDSGIIKSKEKLYVAPEKGYVQELTIGMDEVDTPSSETFYIYLKGRGGKIYSRIEIETENPNIIIQNIWTNPHGSKTLEQLEKPLTGDDRSKLLKEIFTRLGYKDQ